MSDKSFKLLVRMVNTNRQAANLALFLTVGPEFKRNIATARSGISNIRKQFKNGKDGVSLNFPLTDLKGFFEFDLPKPIIGQLKALGYCVIDDDTPTLPGNAQDIDCVEAKTHVDGDTHLQAWTDYGYVISERIPLLLIREAKNEQVQGSEYGIQKF